MVILILGDGILRRKSALQALNSMSDACVIVETRTPPLGGPWLFLAMQPRFQSIGPKTSRSPAGGRWQQDTSAGHALRKRE